MVETTNLQDSEGTETAASPRSKRVDVARLLRDRATELAREPVDGDRPDDSFDVVEFALAGERYGLESTWVREVFPLRELTPLPCTPPFVLGILNVRGQIRTVIDVRRFFDLPFKGLTELNKVIFLSGEGIEVGILADAILGVRSVSRGQLQPSLPTLTGARAEYLRGVSCDGLAVLDAARILGDEKLVVNEEVAI